MDSLELQPRVDAEQLREELRLCKAELEQLRASEPTSQGLIPRASEIQEIIEERDLLLHEVQALTGALQTQRRETQRVQAELTALQDRYSVAAKRDVPGSSTLSSTEASGAEMQVCLGSIELSDEIERLSTELSNCEEERDLFLQELVNMNKALETQRDQIERSRQELVRYQQQTQGWSAVKPMQEKMSQLTLRNEVLMHELESSNHEIEAKTSELDNLKNELSAMQRKRLERAVRMMVCHAARRDERLSRRAMDEWRCVALSNRAARQLLQRAHTRLQEQALHRAINAFRRNYWTRLHNRLIGSVPSHHRPQSAEEIVRKKLKALLAALMEAQDDQMRVVQTSMNDVVTFVGKSAVRIERDAVPSVRQVIFGSEDGTTGQKAQQILRAARLARGVEVDSIG